MRAVVTGANGFLGRHMVGALLARGIEVRAMVRPAVRLEGLGWPSSVEVFRADLRTSRELGRAFEGVDVLLHLAAVVSGGEDAQFAGTVAGTERLLDAMATSTCRQLVLCSRSMTIARPSGRSMRGHRSTRCRMSTPAMAIPVPSGGKSA